jgi:hypothetical protein
MADQLNTVSLALAHSLTHSHARTGDAHLLPHRVIVHGEERAAVRRAWWPHRCGHDHRSHAVPRRSSRWPGARVCWGSPRDLPHDRNQFLPAEAPAWRQDGGGRESKEGGQAAKGRGATAKQPSCLSLPIFTRPRPDLVRPLLPSRLDAPAHTPNLITCSTERAISPTYSRCTSAARMSHAHRLAYLFLLSFALAWVSRCLFLQVLMINIGSLSTGGRVLAVKADLAKIVLTQPVCTETGEKIALSRRIDKCVHTHSSNTLSSRLLACCSPSPRCYLPHSPSID